MFGRRKLIIKKHISSKFWFGYRKLIIKETITSEFGAFIIRFVLVKETLINEKKYYV